MPISPAIDVILVPDFTGPKAAIFEVRTLFFLASWIANAGRAANFPLHLACIGTPPDSVKRLAKRAKADITICQPHPLFPKNPFLNKQIGFSITPQTDYHLLLDIDFWVLSDFSDLSTFGDCIAAAPADHPRVSPAYWLKIYEEFGMTPPSERIRPIRGEYGVPLAHPPFYTNQAADVEGMFPYYQGGMVYAPWSYDLKTRWQENVLRIRSLFPKGDPKHPLHRAVTASDQAGLAVTIEQLRREGATFTRLPPAFHANRVHLYAKGVTAKQIKLYHATGFGNNPKYPLLNYTKLLMHSMRNEWLLQHPNHSVLSYLREYAFPHTKAILSLIGRMWKISPL